MKTSNLFSSRFEKHWSNIWMQLPQVKSFLDWQKSVVSDAGIGIVAGGHNMGKSYIYNFAASRDTYARIWNLPPRMSVDRFYLKLYPHLPTLCDRRERLIKDLDRGSLPSIAFDNAGFLYHQLLDDLSYVYDRTEHCAIFFIEQNALNLNLPSRLKAKATTHTLEKLSASQYHEVLREISKLYPEDTRLAILLAAMEDPDRTYYGDIRSGLALWGGFSKSCELEFRSIESFGEFALAVEKILRVADDTNGDRPLLSEYFVPNLILP